MNDIFCRRLRRFLSPLVFFLLVGALLPQLAWSQTTLHIDPTAQPGGDGSIANPLQTVASFQSNTTYLFKRGTTWTVAAPMSLQAGVTLSDYGDPASARPRIVSAVDTKTHCFEAWGSTRTDIAIRNIDFEANQFTAMPTSIIKIENQTSGSILIDGCRFVGAEYGLRILNCRPDSISIENTEVAFTGNDGIYVRASANLTIRYCHIHDVNQEFWVFGYQDSGLGAGDCIQMDNLEGDVIISHNLLDHSMTGNKFCIVMADEQDASTIYSPVIEYNHLIGQGLGGLAGYAGVLVGQNTRPTVRYNVIENAGTGVYNNSGLVLNDVHDNVFSNTSENGYGPKPDIESIVPGLSAVGIGPKGAIAMEVCYWGGVETTPTLPDPPVIGDPIYSVNLSSDSGLPIGQWNFGPLVTFTCDVTPLRSDIWGVVAFGGTNNGAVNAFPKLPIGLTLHNGFWEARNAGSSVVSAATYQVGVPQRIVVEFSMDPVVGGGYVLTSYDAYVYDLDVAGNPVNPIQIADDYTRWFYNHIPDPVDIGQLGVLQVDNTSGSDIVIENWSIEVSVPEAVPPTIPTGLSLSSVSDLGVRLFWWASEDVDSAVVGYRVWVDGVESLFVRGATGILHGLMPGQTYSVAISAVDIFGNESARSATLSVTIPDDIADPLFTPGDSIIIDFGVPAMVTPEDVPDSAGRYWNNLVDNGPLLGMAKTDGFASGVDLVVVDPFSNQSDGGMQDSFMYPQTAKEDWHYLSSSDSAVLRLNNLDPSYTYTLRFYAGRREKFDGRTTIYSVGAQSVELVVANNSTETAELNGLWPDGSGSIDVGIDVKVGSPFGYLGVLEVIVEESGGGDTTPPTPPGNLQFFDVMPDSILLVYDGSTDDQAFWGYRIYRNGTLLTLVSSIEGGERVFVDEGLLPSTTYQYEIFAVDDAGNESSSQATVTTSGVASGVVPGDRFLVDLGGNGYQSDLRASLTVLDGDSQVWNNLCVPLAHRGALSTTSGEIRSIGWDTSGSTSLGAYENQVSSTLFPDSASGDFLDFEYSALGGIPLIGLSPSETYTIRLFASTHEMGQGTTIFTVDGLPSQAIDPYNNVNTVVEFNGVQPDPTGDLLIGIESIGGSDPFAILNVIEIIVEENVGDTTPPSAPSNLQFFDVMPDSLLLVYDGSTDDQALWGYRINRNGTMVSVGSSIEGGERVLMDTGLLPSTTYQYEIVAIDAAGNESFAYASVTTPVAPSGLVPGDRFLVDLGGRDFQNDLVGNLSVVDGDLQVWNNLCVSFARRETLFTTTGEIRTIGWDTSGLSALGGYENQVSSTLFPDSASGDYFDFKYSTQGGLPLVGLSPSETYTIRLFTSTHRTEQGTTVFTVDGFPSQSIDPYDNAITVIEFSGVQPDMSGNLLIGIESMGGTDPYAILNVMEIIVEEGAGDTTPPTAPSGLTATVSENAGIPGVASVLLAWDASSDDVGVDHYKVYVDGEFSGNSTTASDLDFVILALNGSMVEYYITAVDAAGNESAPSNILTVDVAPGIVSRMFTDFGHSDYMVNTSVPDGKGRFWNSLLSSESSVSLVDSDGTATGVVITVTDAFNGANKGGVDDSTLYPATAQRDSLFVSSGQIGELRMDGLNVASTYTVRLFASRTWSGDRTSVYTIGGQSLSLQAANNTSTTVEFTALVPDAGGSITLRVEAGAGSAYGYLGVLELIENSGGPPPVDTTPPSVPQNLNYTLIPTPNDPNPYDVELTWDPSTDDVGVDHYEVIVSGGLQVINEADTYLRAGVAFSYGYSFAVVAVDAAGNASAASSTVSFVVPSEYPATAEILVDFGSSSITTLEGVADGSERFWNNLAEGESGTAALVDRTGSATTVSLVVTDAFNGANTSGVDVSTLYPATAQKDSLYVSSGQIGEVRIDGLNVGATYTIRLFASRTSSGDRSCVYTIGGQTLTLQAANNTSTTVEFTGLAPSAGGSITLRVEPGAGSSYGYLGVLELIQEN